MVRYPHEGTLKWSSDKAEVDADGNPVSVEVELTIECRVQLGNYGNKNLDFNGKCYTPKVEIEPWTLDNTTLIFNGRSFKIVQFFNFQKHAELWLE